MEAKVDSVGRVLVPKALREALGIQAGAIVDISVYGGGLQIVPHGRTARVVDEEDLLVATGSATLTDGELFALIDAGRR